MQSKEREAFSYLKKKLSRLGELALYGSARRNRAFERNHDFDIGFDTWITSEAFIVDTVESFIDEWDKLFKIELHIYVHGAFRTQGVRNSKYHLMFARKWLKPIQYLNAVLRKRK